MGFNSAFKGLIVISVSRKLIEEGKM